MAAPGDRLAHFLLVREIGRGGMGEVWEARDTRLERAVALKFLAADLREDPVARERFLREARSAAGLDHPFLCSIFEVGESETGRAFIAMELVRGETLEQLLSRGRPPVRASIRIASEVAEALQCAHTSGIVHRDLKPGNIMLTRGERVKVMDFGLAKRVDAIDPDQPTVTSLTRAGASVGTPAYMAPEQLRGEPVDARADLFALGIVLFRMVTGVHPFAGGSTWATASAILTRPAESIARHVPDAPSGLEELLARLLAKDPADRIASADETRRALVELLDEQPSGVAPAPVARRTRTARARLGPALVGSVLLAAVLAAVPLTRRWLGPATGPTESVARSPVEWYREGMRQLARWDLSDNVDHAIAAFQKALELDPRHAAAQAGLGEAYRHKTYLLEDPSFVRLAIEHTARAVDLDPHLAIARTFHGLALLEDRQLDAAMTELEEALTIDPGNVGARRGVARVHEARGRVDEAEREYAEARAEDPSDWETYALLGSLLFNEGRFADAEGVYRDGIVHAPDNPQLYFNLAAAQQMQGRYDDAAASYQRSLEISPTANAYSNLGTLLFFQARYSEAAAAYRSAVERNPGQYLLWANLADAYRWLPDHEDEARDAYATAMRLVQEALRDAPDDLVLLSRLAVFQAKAGRPDDARATLALVERAAPDDLNVLYRMTLAYEISGDRAGALRSIEGAIRRGYPLPEIRRDPELEGLRNSIGFQELVTRLERGG